LGIVKPYRKKGRTVMYKINLDHPLVKRLNEIINETSLRIAEEEAKKQARKISVSK